MDEGRHGRKGLEIGTNEISPTALRVGDIHPMEVVWTGVLILKSGALRSETKTAGGGTYLKK